MSREGSHFINGHWFDGDGTDFSSYEPGTGRLSWEGRAATREEVDRAVSAAHGAFESWADTELAKRTRYLERYAELVTKDKSLFAAMICEDTGKPRWEAFTEVDAIIGKIAVSIDAYSDRCCTVAGHFGAAATFTRFKPHGVMAVLGPFNLPGHLPNGHIVPALLAGNTVVFKPSSQGPLIAQAMVEAWEAAGLPPGVINLVQGRAETGTALYTHPRIAGVLFTGSDRTGKLIHNAFAGRPDKILALEMGGNNPLVVHEVENIQAAAYLTAVSAFITAGQRCTCARRLIVPAGDAGDSFVQFLIETIGKITTGLYSDEPEPFMGPVIADDAAEKVLAARQRLSDAGGVTLVDVKPLRDMKALLSPGLMDVTSVADRRDEEIFGPFLQLIRVRDFDAAIREANNTAFGLAAGLVSDNKALYEMFYRKMRAGVINWNRQITGASSRMPFGGIGLSGSHRPSAYFAADYSSFPVASIEVDRTALPSEFLPGFAV